MKKIYYYNRKFPEYEIKEMEVLDKLYVKGKGIKYLYALTTRWNIDMNCEEDFDRNYYIYAPYEDEGIYVYENSLGNEYVLSFDKKLIKQWHKEDCKILKHKLQERLRKLEELK